MNMPLRDIIINVQLWHSSAIQWKKVKKNKMAITTKEMQILIGKK